MTTGFCRDIGVSRHTVAPLRGLEPETENPLGKKNMPP